MAAKGLPASIAGRTSERQDNMEDMIEEMSEYCLQLCIKELTVQEVQKIAGPKAVWPPMPTEDALDTLRDLRPAA